MFTAGAYWPIWPCLDSDARNKIRNFNPYKYDLIRDLMDPYIKSVENIDTTAMNIVRNKN